MSVEQELQQYYTQGGLAAAIDASLRNLGKDPERVTHDDLELIDELHIGGRAATLEFLQACGFQAGQLVLDVGSGLGGPARTAAVTSGVRVVGIDLTPEFVEVARELSRRVGLAERTEFVVGSALDLPFQSGRFDGATMIHVGMNIADKSRLFREVRRVIAPGGTFAIYDVMRNREGPLSYPVPWSGSADTSFVETPGHYEAALRSAGFEIVAAQGRTAKAAAALGAQMAKAAAGGAPRMLHRGPKFKEKAENLLAMVQSGLVGPWVLIARASA